MARMMKKVGSFGQVAAGATAIAELPVGLTYHSLFIRYKRNGADATKAQIAAEIEEIRLVIDADEKVKLSGAELHVVNDYYGYGFEDGVIQIVFSRPNMRQQEGEDALAWGTADVQVFNVEIDIAAGVTNPSLQIHALQGPAQKMGVHCTIRRFDGYDAQSAGPYEISNIPRGDYALLGLHMTTANTKTVEIERDGKIISQVDQQVIKAHYGHTGRTIQAGMTHVDFSPTNRLSDRMSLKAQDFRLRLDMSAPANFRIIAERLEGHVPGQ
ncbi:hypothetical protein WH96_06580 [Kiloniella spongiae]|uniref:Uncharacterized protein n=1 Tax=Kiloniella spongiae TaxID=1489064 RepID=A0A0H2MKM9_9PROT|nr:major capsid protein P2 [Kiloniella spongiae]KLN61312.1 hypothetical protein WH96_06580 [Kiloniella spongiae]